MVIIRNVIAILLVGMAVSCSTTRVVKPLEKGEKSVGAAFGGPGIIYAGAPIPLPFSSLTYSHGIDTGLTVTGSVQTTSLAFGVAHIDATLGIRIYESKSERFGITGSPGIHVMYDFHKGHYRNYPQLEAVSWWQYSESDNLIYGGMGTWIELIKTKAHGQVQNNEVLPWIMIGHQFNRPNWTYTTELKYLGFQHNTTNTVVDYVPQNSQGVVGLYLGVSRRFGK